MIRVSTTATLLLSCLIVMPALALAQPDLVMTTVSTSATLVGVGTSVAVTNAVTNQGTTSAGLAFRRRNSVWDHY